MQILSLLAVIIGLILNIYVFVKSLGYFEYRTEEERKEYEDWLEREGINRRVRSIMGIIFWIATLIMIIYYTM